MASTAWHQHIAESLDFAMEVVEGFLAHRTARDHHLDRHPPISRELSGTVNLTHSSFANQLFDQIVGTGLGELPATGIAGLAEPDDTESRCRRDSPVLFVLNPLPTEQASAIEPGATPRTGSREITLILGPLTE
jgi:hypothetical protein